MKNKKRFLLGLVLIVALVLRVWGLDKVPPELFGDELDVGYHAYSLLKTGRDYYGQLLPTYIHSFSEWRAPLLMYVTAPFVGLFGLNEWGVRLPSAVFGTLTVLMIYLLVEKTLKNEKVALFSAALLAVSPWHLQYSRAAFEASLLLFLLTSATFFFIKGIKQSNWLYLSALAFALTFYTYSTANVFTPLLILLLVLVYRKKVVQKGSKVIGPVLAFILLCVPIAYQIVFGSAAQRFEKFSLFNDPDLIRQINEKRQFSDSSLNIFFHNKPVYWARKFAANYTSAFSPQFLFVSGDVTFRHSVHDVGELYWFSLPLVVYGVYSLVQNKDKNNLLWLSWLVLAPIPSALTRDGAIHATRLILMLPALTVVTAYGGGKLLEGLPKTVLAKLGLVFFLIIALSEATFYFNDYWHVYPIESWRWWHTGYKESITFMKENESNYQKIVFNNTYEPALIRFLFYWQYPPEDFIDQFVTDESRADALPGLQGFSLNNRYFFGTAKDAEGGVIRFIQPGMLYLVSHRDEVGGDWDWEKEPPVELKVLDTTRNPFGDPIFYVVTKKLTTGSSVVNNSDTKYAAMTQQ